MQWRRFHRARTCYDKFLEITYIVSHNQQNKCDLVPTLNVKKSKQMSHKCNLVLTLYVKKSKQILHGHKQRVVQDDKYKQSFRLLDSP